MKRREPVSSNVTVPTSSESQSRVDGEIAAFITDYALPPLLRQRCRYRRCPEREVRISAERSLTRCAHPSRRHIPPSLPSTLSIWTLGRKKLCALLVSTWFMVSETNRLGNKTIGYIPMWEFARHSHIIQWGNCEDLGFHSKRMHQLLSESDSDLVVGWHFMRWRNGGCVAGQISRPSPK